MYVYITCSELLKTLDIMYMKFQSSADHYGNLILVQNG